MKVLVFIPCYNCAPQVSRTIAQITPAVAKHVNEVLVVDNGSTDDTPAKAKAALAKLKGIKVTLVQNTNNYHLGGSHKVAFAYARLNNFSHVCVLHGDDQGRIADAIPFFKLAARDESVSWLGSRFMRSSRLKGYGWARIVGNWGFNVLFSLATRRWLSDLGSGLNLFSVKGMEKVDISRFGDNLMFNYYLILAICRLGISYRYFPISWREDDQVSNVRLFSHGRKTLALLMAYLMDPVGFLMSEHRAKPVKAYTWKVLFTTAKGGK